MVAGFREFEFDLPEALLAKLIHALDNLAAAPLLAPNLAEIPDAQGVYQLLLKNRVVYIGKTDADAGLRRRLERHSNTIQHRKNLDAAEVSFRAIRVFVFTAMDLETQLIRHYGAIARVAWNLSGFGSNDPGRKRDMTELKEEGFDAQYPVDIDRVLEADFSQCATAAEALRRLRQALPYTFRFETTDKSGRPPHPELVAAKIGLPAKKLTTRKLIEAVVSALPKGWQATALAGRVVLYREKQEYPFGTVISRS